MDEQHSSLVMAGMSAGGGSSLMNAALPGVESPLGADAGGNNPDGADTPQQQSPLPLIQAPFMPSIVQDTSHNSASSGINLTPVSGDGVSREVFEISDGEDGSVVGAAAAAGEDDDEITILAVRQALRVPNNLSRNRRRPATAPTRRQSYSPVNLLDTSEDDTEAVVAAGSQPRGKSAQHAADLTGSQDQTATIDEEDEEGDVCAICLLTPRQLSVPESCTHRFCFACLSAWTKVQLTAIYEQQQKESWSSLVANLLPLAVNSKKKTAPTCPLCKAEYRFLRKATSTVPTAVSAAPAAASSAATSSSPTNGGSYQASFNLPYTSISIYSILPPPREALHRPTLSFHNPQYERNDYFRLAAETALNFVMRTAPTLREQILGPLLMQHPRVNALLKAFPPFRARFSQVQHDLVVEVIRARNDWNRRMQRDEMQRQQQNLLLEQDRARQREEMLAVDRGDGVLGGSSSSSAAAASSAYGTPPVGSDQPYRSQQQLLSFAFGPTYTSNPILTIYRESRSCGAITSQAGRWKMWTSLGMHLRWIPPKPDIMSALRVVQAGGGLDAFANMAVGSASEAVAAPAAAMDVIVHAAAAAATAAAASSPRDELRKWLNEEMHSILPSSSSTSLQSFSPASQLLSSTQPLHFMVPLVLNYLDLVLSKLQQEERRRNLQRENRAMAQALAGSRSNSKKASAINAVAQSVDEEPPPLVTYSSASPTLGAAARTPLQSPPPQPDEIIELDSGEDEPEVSHVAAAHGSIPASSSRSTLDAIGIPKHLHTVFVFNTNLSLAVEYLTEKLEEFLRGFTSVFLHRLVLYILGLKYNHPVSAVSDTAQLQQQQQQRAVDERHLAELLQEARTKFQLLRSQHLAAILQHQRPQQPHHVPSSFGSGASSDHPTRHGRRRAWRARHSQRVHRDGHEHSAPQAELTMQQGSRVHVINDDETDDDERKQQQQQQQLDHGENGMDPREDDHDARPSSDSDSMSMSDASSSASSADSEHGEESEAGHSPASTTHSGASSSAGCRRIWR